MGKLSINRACIISLLIVLLSLAGGCSPAEPVPSATTTTPVAPVNHAPGISYIDAPAEAAPSATETVKCIAEDQDGDQLMYTWKVSGGQFSGSGSEIQWTAPAAAGNYSIECSVTDGKSVEVRQSHSISIVEKPVLPPVISKIIFTKDDNIPIEIIPGQQAKSITVAKWRTSHIECVAGQPEGKALSYLWAASMGTIEGQGSSVKYITSGITGDALVMVTVIDSSGAKARASVSINIPCCGEGAFGQSGT
jgi:hypothetical protein